MDKALIVMGLVKLVSDQFFIAFVPLFMVTHVGALQDSLAPLLTDFNMEGSVSDPIMIKFFSGVGMAK